MIEDRDFPADGTFGAYYACEKWLRDLGCSTGSMERGNAIAVMFSDDYSISKYSGLSKREKAATHGWITPLDDSRFRDAGVRFRVTDAGKKYLVEQKVTA